MLLLCATPCLTLNSAPSEVPWISNAYEQIDLKENNSNELNAKLEYLRKQYARKIKEKKQLFFATVNNENDYSKDEIKAIEKKIERIGKEANVLEVKLVNIENQAEHSQIVVKKLKGIMNSAESDYARIKSLVENDLDDLKLKTMKKFNSAADEKVKMKKKKKKSSFFSRFHWHKKKKSELSWSERRKLKKSHKSVKLESPTEKSSSRVRLVEKRAKTMKKAKKQSAKNKAVAEDTQFLFTLKSNNLLIDDFNSAERKNILGNRSNTYQMAPSTTLIDFQTDTIEGVKSGVIRIEFDKKNKGGPHWKGGWCGYYTMLKDENTDSYLNASNFNYVSFWVKGETGRENFAIGLADKRWDELGDSVKSNQVTYYAKNSKLNKTWQKVKIPLEEFTIDKHKLASLSICFESFCFPNGDGYGSVYIDNIALEQ